MFMSPSPNVFLFLPRVLLGCLWQSINQWFILFLVGYLEWFFANVLSGGVGGLFIVYITNAPGKPRELRAKP